MSNIGKAIAGVAASGGVLFGAYALDGLEASREREAARECAALFEGEARAACVEDGNSDGTVPTILGVTGLVGVVGCGYLGYKALKEELGTTGLIDDHL